MKTMLPVTRPARLSNGFSLVLLLLILFTGANAGNAQRPGSLSSAGATLQLAVNVDDDSLNAIYMNALHAEIKKSLKLPVARLHPAATTFVDSYLKRSREELLVVQKRSAGYFKTIETILKKYELPTELKYLAVIESQLKTSAVSHAGAAGMWQLMPQTARSLGLKVSAHYDERKHFVKSTTAAAAYIKSLYAQFDDWLLVVAAYNSGAGTVGKAIKKGGSRDFWKIQQYLPAETKAHVKRYIGAHYFFEHEGSATTLTKSELVQYRKAIVEHEETLKVLEEIKIQSVEATNVLATDTKPQKGE